MKRYQARKAISVLLTVLMLLSSVYLGLGVIASALTTADWPTNTTTLSNGAVYTVSGNTTVDPSKALTVPENATVFIQIAATASLTITGSNASGTTAGKAAIKMNQNSKLIFIGSGTLTITGGNGADGSNGSNNSGTSGGNGGNGGAGGGAGIGTDGGNGGARNSNVNNGSAAGSWPSGASVIIADTVEAHTSTANGSNGSSGSNGTQGSAGDAGGAGGGGGAGKGGAAIGTGGGGGGGGTKGGDGKSASSCSSASKGSNGSHGNEGADIDDKGYTTTTAFSDMETALTENADILAMTQAEQIELGSTALTAAYTAIDDARTAVNDLAPSSGVFAFFFGSYSTAIAQLEASKLIAQYKPIVDEILDYIATDYSNYTKAQLVTLYTDLNTKYTSYKDINNQTVYNYFEGGTNPILTRTTVDAALAAIQNAQEIAVLREEVKPQIDAALATIATYNQDWVVATDNADVPLSNSLNAIDGFITALAGYKPENVTVVFGANYASITLQAAKDKINGLLTDNGYKVRFAQYVTVYNQAFAPVTVDYTNEQLYSVLSARDTWYTQLQAFVGEITEYDAVLAGKVLGELEAQMEAKIDSVYALLNTRVEAQIENAYELYTDFRDVYGYTINTSDDITVQNYNALRTAFNQLNPDHYTFLLNTDHFAVSEGTQNHYNEIKNAVFAFVNYDATKGLSAYEYNKETATDILREYDVNADKVRNLDYTVDAAKRATAYENVKKLLDSDLVKETLGFDLNGTIGDLLDGLPEKIYTDDFLNTLVQYVYPMVTLEFAKVWGGLPTSVETTVDGNDVSIDTLNIDKMNVALNKLGLALLPQLLQANVRTAGFTAVADKLNQVDTVTTYNKTTNTVTVDSWKHSAIYDAETEKLTLEWGITDQESFVNAAVAALSGVEPLLLALLSNKEYKKENINVGDGSGEAAGCVSITITAIKLYMNFTGNPGYNNAIAPILSALGADNLPQGNTLTTTRKIIEEGLINPIHSVLETIKDEPLDAILGILPNLAYAMDFGLVMPLLNQLKTNIKYWANADYKYWLFGNKTGTAEDALGTKDGDGMPINLGEMLDLASMGFDLSSANGLVKSIVGLMNKSDEVEEETEEEEEIMLPLDFDQLFQKIAYLGTGVEWKTGYRTSSPFNWPGHEADFPRITANRPEIFAYLVESILSAMANDDELLPKLLELLAEKDEAGNPKPIELPEMVNTLIDNICENPNDAIAAIVELMIPQEYNNWAELETPATTFIYGDDETEVTPADVAYLKYANDWDKPTATAIATNVDELIPTIAGLLGSDISLNETLQGLLNGVFTNENITTINNALAGLAAPADEGEEEGGIDLLGILKKVAGIDLSGIAAVDEDYNWGFEDGDKAGFVSVLCGLLEPLSPLLKIMLPGEDLSVLDGIVNVKGYDVYPHTFAYLFDALGIDQVTGYENMTASEELEAILNALLAWVDDLTAEGNSMIKDLLEVLPDLVYFIESNGLSVLIKNLLYPIQIVIDTIRPIYPVDLFELVGGLLADTGLELDLEDLKMSTIISLVDAKLGTNLTYSPLGAYAIPALTIKHGSLDAADVLTILLCGVIEALEYKVDEDATNADILFGYLAENADDPTTINKIADIYKKIVPIVTGGESQIDPDKITPINWSYMVDEIQLDDFEMPEYSNEAVINYLSTYDKNQWTAELAEYLNDNLDSIVKDVLKVAGQDENYLATLINGLINDNLYTADVVNAAGEAIYGLLADLEDQLKVVIDAMLGTEIAGKTYTPVASVNGKADFIKAFVGEGDEPGILTPFYRILGFALFGESYKFFNGTTREDLITITGGDAYDAALVPVLEALGVNMPKKATFTSTDDAIDKILTAVTDRLDAICADPINEILDLLPNVLYFLNADGLKAIINNAVLPFDALVEAVTGDPIATLLAGVDVGGVALNDLNTTALLTLIEGLAGITIPDAIKTAISTFYIGKAVKQDSANGKLAFKLAYDGDRKDMITILASVLIEVLAYEDNASILKGVSEEAYQAVLNILGKSDEEITVPMKVPEWLYPEAADTDQTFSAINTSTEFGAYGPLFTQEMAIYLANNLDDFIDNMIYLLGIPADALEGLGIHSSTDEYITSLKDLLNTVIGDTVYTTDIADLLLNLVEDKLVKTVNDLTINGVNMSDIVKNVLKTALKVDLDRYTNGTEFTKDGEGKYHVQPFADGSKEGFLNALVQILDPLYPVLNWLLCEEDLHFFTDSNGDHQITLKGGQGYKYGIIPILETFDCTDLPTQEAVSATTDTASLVNLIANPLLSRIDKLLENPVDEIFELLPNVAYFINSKGLDACVRNMTNAINVVLKALQPLVGDVDLFAAIGIDLSTLDMQYILNAITGMIGEDSDLTPLVVDALAELTTGKIVTSSSQSELTPWYKMEYAGEASKADTITTLLRFALRWVGLNGEKLKPIVREKIEMSDEGYAYIDKLIDIAAAYAGTNSGMDSLLHMLYYIFYGIHTGSASVAGWQRDYNSRFEAIAEGQKAATKTDENLGKVAELLDWLFVTYGDGDSDDTGNVYHNYDDDEMGSPAAGKPKGFAPNGFIAFFRQIIEWFKTIFNKIFKH